jgi:hypothetical protein
MMEPRVWDVDLLPFQMGFFNSKERFPAMVAGWGTGKTMCAILKIMDMSIRFPNNQGLILRKNFTDLRDSTMADFKKYTGLRVKVQDKEVILSNGSIILFRHADELIKGTGKKDTGIQNINLGWFFIEQAEEFENEGVFHTLRGRLRRENCPHQGIVIANTNGHNWIWRLWKNKNIAMPSDSVIDEMVKESGVPREDIIAGCDPAQYKLIEAKAFDNRPNLSADFLADLAKMKLDSPSHYRRFVLNSWEDVDTADKVIPYAKILDAVDRDLRDYGSDSIVISCDPAEFGDDKTVIFVFKGLKVIETIVLTKRSLMETAGHIMALHYKYHSQSIAVDDIGVGAGVRARLKELKAPVVAINSGTRAPDKVRYSRLRDQMWMNASQLFKDDYVSIPDDEILIEDLAAFSYSMSSAGQVVIARKKDIKKELGRSPDRGDALVQGLWLAKKTVKPVGRPFGKMKPQIEWNPLTHGL